MRSKLHLTDEEVMNKSWIALNLEMSDFPWYNHNAKKVISGAEADAHLAKYIKK